LDPVALLDAGAFENEIARFFEVVECGGDFVAWDTCFGGDFIDAEGFPVAGGVGGLVDFSQ